MTGVAKRFKSVYLLNVPILHILTSNKLVEQWNGFMKPSYTIERTLNLICIKWKSRIITWSLLLIESHKWENLYDTIFGAKCFNSQLTIFLFNESDFNVFFSLFFSIYRFVCKHISWNYSNFPFIFSPITFGMYTISIRICKCWWWYYELVSLEFISIHIRNRQEPI